MSKEPEIVPSLSELGGSPGRDCLLHQAVALLALAEEARKGRKGQTTIPSQRGAPRAHPGARLEASCRTAASRIIAALEQSKPGPDPFPGIPTWEQIEAKGD